MASSLRDRIVSLIEALKERAQNSRIRPFMEKIGIYYLLKQSYIGYCNLMTAVMGTTTKDIRVGDTTATFLVKTGSELAHLESLDGEGPVIRDMLDTLSPDDVFYDIGANIGVYAILAAKKCGGGNVYAFDPHRESLEQLDENAKLNNLSITTQAFAFSDESQESTLRMEGTEAGTTKHTVVDDGYGEAIRTVRGDEAIQRDEMQPPTMMKIDVEGMELNVLRGFADSLRKSVHTIYCEVHPDRMESMEETPSQVSSFLEQNGFNVKRIHSRGTQYFLKATR